MDATNDRQRLMKDELRQRGKHEPSVKSNHLKCPNHLCEDAKKEWRRIVKLYGEFKTPILCDLDCNALEVYCNAVVTYRKAKQKVIETSEVYMRKGDPTPRKNPWQRVADEAAEQMKKYSEQLLLTPVSRARFGLAMAKKDEEPTGFALFKQKYLDERRSIENAPRY
jgi:P27 family predicted phage terminase small subunit